MFDNISNTQIKITETQLSDEERIILTAKNRADMKAAICAAPTYNIRSQLRYRYKNGLYKYDDLVDPMIVTNYINKRIYENIIPDHINIPIIHIEDIINKNTVRYPGYTPFYEEIPI